MNRPHPLRHRLDRMLQSALEEPLATDVPARGRFERILQRIDDNLVEL